MNPISQRGLLLSTILVCLLLCIFPFLVHSAESARFDNVNYFIKDHPIVVSLTLHEDGSMSGFTEDGRPFLQHTILMTDNVRVDTFEIEDHSHFIINGSVVYTTDELSRRLAQI